MGVSCKKYTGVLKKMMLLADAGSKKVSAAAERFDAKAAKKSARPAVSK